MPSLTDRQDACPFIARLLCPMSEFRTAEGRSEALSEVEGRID
jgi:hypothetical protein